MLIKYCDAINKPVSSTGEKSLWFEQEFVLNRSPRVGFLVSGFMLTLGFGEELEKVGFPVALSLIGKKGLQRGEGLT